MITFHYPENKNVLLSSNDEDDDGGDDCDGEILTIERPNVFLLLHYSTLFFSILIRFSLIILAKLAMLMTC